MRNIKLVLKFVGTRYHGWQIQKNGITVQQVVTEALSVVTKTDNIRLVGCGRTDAGVHASMYVANFFTDSAIPADKFPLALNTQLPDDIVCICAEDVSDDFDASGSATAKKYTYTVLNSVLSDPFKFPFSHQVKFPLNVEKMKIAAEAFVGTHDFVGFAASGFTVKTTVRTIYSVDITKNGDVITFDVKGNGFLYNMVRIIAGTLIAVGCGMINAEDVPDIIESKERRRAGATAPAKGLCLTEVYYGEL